MESKIALKKVNTNFRLEHSVRKKRTTLFDDPLLPEIFHWNDPNLPPNKNFRKLLESGKRTHSRKRSLVKNGVLVFQPHTQGRALGDEVARVLRHNYSCASQFLAKENGIGQPPPQALRFSHGRGERETSDW